MPGAPSLADLIPHPRGPWRPFRRRRNGADPTPEPPTHDDLPTVLDVVARLGEGLLACGAPTADVTTTSLRVADALGAGPVQVDVTVSAVTVSAAHGDVTVLRVVRARGTDYTRLAALVEVAREIVAETLPVEEAATRVKRAASSRRPYSERISSLGNVGLATAVAVMIGGGWTVAAAAAVTTWVADQLVRALARRDLPTFFQQFLGAGTATTLAVLLSTWAGVPTSFVVSAGIVVLIPGLTLVTAAEDAISGYSQTATVRAFEALLLTTGLVVGIAVSLDVARRAGFDVALSFGQGSNPLILQGVAAAAISACFAVANYSTRRTVALAAAVGAGAWLVRLLAGQVLPPTGAVVAAALAIGVASELVAPRLRVPTVVVSIAAILPLLPALDIYRAIWTVVQVSSDAGSAQLITALGTTLALAAGVGFGEFVAASSRGVQDRASRWVRRQAAARP